MGKVSDFLHICESGEKTGALAPEENFEKNLWKPLVFKEKLGAKRQRNLRLFPKLATLKHKLPNNEF